MAVSWPFWKDIGCRDVSDDWDGLSLAFQLSPPLGHLMSGNMEGAFGSAGKEVVTLHRISRSL